MLLIVVLMVFFGAPEGGCRSNLGGEATAKEYADTAGCSPSSARARLNALHESGSVSKTKIGRAYCYAFPPVAEAVAS